MSSYLRPRRGKKATAISQLTAANPLKRGEIFFEVPDTGVGTGAGKIKMGDGVTAYESLPYFSEGGSGGGGVGEDITISLASTNWTTETISGVTYYVQNGAAAGATTNTIPVIVPIYTTDAEMEAYSNIIRCEASTNVIKFIAVAKPSVDLTVVAKFAVESTADLDVISAALGVEITQEQYDLLTPEQKATGTYWIIDGSSSGVVTDTTLNVNSHNAIQNAPVATAINQINADLTDLRRNGVMPNLDFANPLYRFDSTHTTTTTTKDCYLYGMIIGANAKIYIDGTDISIRDYATSSNDVTSVSSPLKIKAGSVVSIGGSVTDATATLRLYDVVSD